MAYSTANQPYLIAGPVGGGFIGGSTNVGGALWGYRSTDPIGTVGTTGYFTNGHKLGMRPSDVVICMVTSGSTPAALHHLMISSVSTNGASPTIIGSSA